VGNAQELLPALFEKGEIKTLYLNFSDPWPKKGYAKRRLTHRNFLAMYRALLPEDGKIIFKTDNVALFDFSLEEFAAAGYRIEDVTRDLHNSEYNHNNIQTEYERNFSAKGFPIHRVVAYVN
jgi:tRNA (guanine-N7-)-methyltransferase